MQNDSGCYGISKRQSPVRSEVWVRVSNGYGSTNTVIRRFSTVVKNTGPAITYTDSAALGASFTINESGVYSIYYSDCGTPIGDVGVSINSNQLATSLESISASNILAGILGTANDITYSVSVSAFLFPGDIIRPHTSAGAASSNTWGQIFHIVKVSN